MTAPESRGRPIFLDPSRYKYLTGAGSANGGLAWWVVLVTGGSAQDVGSLEDVTAWEHILDRASGREFVAVFGASKVRVQSVEPMGWTDWIAYRDALQATTKQQQIMLDLNDSTQERMF